MWLVYSQIVGILIMAAISYLPFLQDIFKTGPLTVVDWAVLVVAAVFVLCRRSEKMVRASSCGGAARRMRPCR